MDADRTQQIMRALNGALSVFQEAKGRRTAADIRVQSMISAARLVLAQRVAESDGRGPDEYPRVIHFPPGYR